MGEQGGNAVPNVLFGHGDPGGKLASTIARSVGQLPVFYNVKPSAPRGFDTVAPLFLFGGLIVVEPGAFDVIVGPNSVDLKTSVPHVGDWNDHEAAPIWQNCANMSMSA